MQTVICDLYVRSTPCCMFLTMFYVSWFMDVAWCRYLYVPFLHLIFPTLCTLLCLVFQCLGSTSAYCLCFCFCVLLIAYCLLLLAYGAHTSSVYFVQAPYITITWQRVLYRRNFWPFLEWNVHYGWLLFTRPRYAVLTLFGSSHD